MSYEFGIVVKRVYFGLLLKDSFSFDVIYTHFVNKERLCHVRDICREGIVLCQDFFVFHRIYETWDAIFVAYIVDQEVIQCTK